MKQNSDFLQFSCDVCFDSFGSAFSLAEHKNVHSGEKPFLCPNCGEAFKLLQDYIRHWGLKVCSSKKLNKHLCLSPDFTKSIVCSCFKTFKTRSDFRAHIGPEPYACCSCSMTFTIIGNLLKHTRTHTQQKPYLCKQCGRGFSQSANLRNHLSTHLGANAVKCNLCSFSCKTPAGLFKHKKKHKDGNEVYDMRKISNREFECHVCQKRFRFHRNLGMHMKSHDPAESLCPECGKLFPTKAKLSEHVRNSHGESCVCPECGKVLASASLLRTHSKIHVSEKEFRCLTCLKAFAVKSYLVYHMKTHDDQKRFSCDQCGKSFKVASSLKYHSRISCPKLNITD